MGFPTALLRTDAAQKVLAVHAQTNVVTFRDVNMSQTGLRPSFNSPAVSIAESIIGGRLAVAV